VGPWVARQIHAWFDDPPEPTPDETRAGFITYAKVRAVLDRDPGWEGSPHGDLQVHSTDSDGTLPLQEMAHAASELGRAFIACTDHSKSLRIANGQDEERLADQGRRIAAFNGELEAAGSGFRLLRSIEMDVDTMGAGDMDPAALAELDLVLGAFHSALRSKDDQTARYVAALENPNVHVLAHPKARMYGRRVGIVADWSRVFDAAAVSGKAMEIDATIARQDLSVELATLAASRGVQWFSIGSDAHRISELSFLPFGMAIAALAGIPRERILNYRPESEVRAWARFLSASSKRSSRS
jgi:histidinol phosphatase-like PHP family hydrolase